jgi:hypothetical protein
VIVAIESHQGALDMQISTIGLDIAKNVFQVHGIDAAEKVVVRKRLRRRQVLEFFKALPPCLIGMEACATAHYWARELTKLGHHSRPIFFGRCRSAPAPYIKGLPACPGHYSRQLVANAVIAASRVPSSPTVRAD